MSNINLQTAKNAKFDEFYTLEQPIIDELSNYTVDDTEKNIRNQFKGKTVLCNCDDPEWSNFWKYFVKNFDKIGLARLISTHYEKNGNSSYKLEYYGNQDIDGNPIFKRTELHGNGDFRSDECLALLNEIDIVVTNPPYSIFREYICVLLKHDVKFIILGNMNATTYKDIFPYIKENQLHLGIHSGSMDFRVPDYFEKDNVYKKDGVKYAKFGNICWFTNMEHYRMHEYLPLDSLYSENKQKYPKYDEYDAINISRIKDIPADYTGVMGVPLTFLSHYNAQQFNLIGIDRYVEDNPHYGHRFHINGKEVYARILIKRRVS